MIITEVQESAWERWRSLGEFDQWSGSLLSQTAILILDGAIFTSKISSRFPQVVGRCASMMLRFVGLLSLGDMKVECVKRYCDLKWAFREGNCVDLTRLVVKVAVSVTDILLLLGCAVTSVFGIFMTVAPFYSLIAPIGFASFVADVGLQLDSWNQCSQLGDEFDSYTPEECEKVTMEFKKLVVQRSEPNIPFDSLAARLFRQMGAWDLEGNLDDLKGRLSHLQWHSAGNIFLIAFGYMSRGICRAYPDSAVQSGLELMNAAFYWVKSVDRWAYGRR